MDQDHKLLAEAYTQVNEGPGIDAPHPAPMNAERHLESAMYMARNLLTGDEEQTRIEDEDYLNELPPELHDQCVELISRGNYDPACEIYIRYHGREAGLTELNFKHYMPALLQAANDIWEALYEGMSDDDFEGNKEQEKQQEMQEWIAEIKRNVSGISMNDLAQ